MVKLYCLLKPEPFFNAFPVQARSGQDISDLRESIKKKRILALREVNATELVLYSVSIANKDDATLEELYRKIDEGDPSLSVLSPVATVGQSFPLAAPDKVQVVVRIQSNWQSLPPTWTFPCSCLSVFAVTDNDLGQNIALAIKENTREVTVSVKEAKARGKGSKAILL